MPKYEFEHPGHRFEVWFDMGTAPAHVDCPAHWLLSSRCFDNIYHQEDRCHMARNPRTGSTHSDALGTEYPQDRKSRDALYASRGLEPVTAASMPETWKTAKAYAEHIQTGGAPMADLSSLAEKPEPSPSLHAMMKAKPGFKIQEARHDPTPTHQAAQMAAILNKAQS